MTHVEKTWVAADMKGESTVTTSKCLTRTDLLTHKHPQNHCQGEFVSQHDLYKRFQLQTYPSYSCSQVAIVSNRSLFTTVVLSLTLLPLHHICLSSCLQLLLRSNTQQNSDFALSAALDRYSPTGGACVSNNMYITFFSIASVAFHPVKEALSLMYIKVVTTASLSEVVEVC